MLYKLFRIVILCCLYSCQFASAAIYDPSLNRNLTDSIYLITGIIKGADINGSKVYLVNKTLQKYVDSTKVSDNRFVFTGHVKEPIYCFIWFKKSRYTISCFLENTAINIKIKMDNHDYSFDALKVESKGYNQSLIDTLQVLEKKYNDSLEVLQKKYNLLKQKKAPESKLDNIETKFSIVKDSINEVKLKFATIHLNSYLAPILLQDVFRDKSDLKKLKYYFNLLPDNIKSSYEGLNVKKRIEFFKQSAKTGDDAPRFVLRDSAGILADPLQKAKSNHKYSLIIFWASWCSPCIKEIPELRVIYHKYNGKTFTMTGISIDNNHDKWKRALSQFKMPWQQLIDKHDKSASVSRKYGVQTIPKTFIVNPSGKIIEKGLSGKKLMHYIDSVLTSEKHLK